ncbi:uncharacterized protein VICG_01724, partial [Vittaforma corneae ATCC 50505]
MSALFNFESFLRLAILMICTSTYLKRKFPTIFSKKNGWYSLLYKCCIIGERLSPFVGILCLFFGLKRLVNFF